MFLRAMVSCGLTAKMALSGSGVGVGVEVGGGDEVTVGAGVCLMAPGSQMASGSAPEWALGREPGRYNPRL